MKRDSNIDLLRILSCILVIIIHISSLYINKYSVEDGNYFKIANFFDSFSRVAVPIFVIISGRYALASKEKNKNNYYLKILRKIYLPTVIWSLIYLILSYFFIYDREWEIPLRALLEGVPFYHLWYPYMCIFLYFLAPYLIKFKNKYGEKALLKLGVLALMLGIFLSFLQEYFIYIDIYKNFKFLIYFKHFWYYNYFKFILYLGYFILGYSLKDIKISKITVFLGYLITSFILFIIVQKTGNIIFYNYNFIPTVIGSFLLYLTFTNWNVKYNFSEISKNTFNIYLIHAGVIELLKILMKNMIYVVNPIYSIPLLTIFVFIFSFFLSTIFKKFFNI